MICLTVKECSTWLNRHGISEAPYAKKPSGNRRYLQFAPPKELDCSALIASFFEAIGEFSGAVLHITDWVNSDYEADPTTGLRESIGETRTLIDVPGFLFDRCELSPAIDFGSLILGRYWTSYTYLTSGVATVLLWEGELIDVWTRDQRLAAQLRDTLQSIEARIVHDHGYRRV